MKIAIVDDNRAIRKTLRTGIETHTDWEICGEAENGEAAVALVQATKPDLVVLDLSMPLLNGLEAARQVRAIAPATGMVLFTNYASPELTTLARSVGISAVISKDSTDVVIHLIEALRKATRAGGPAVLRDQLK
jgi:two-component system, NarL family, response regulator